MSGLSTIILIERALHYFPRIEVKLSIAFSHVVQSIINVEKLDGVLRSWSNNNKVQ